LSYGSKKGNPQRAEKALPQCLEKRKPKASRGKKGEKLTLRVIRREKGRGEVVHEKRRFLFRGNGVHLIRATKRGTTTREERLFGGAVRFESGKEDESHRRFGHPHRKRENNND